MQSVNYIATKSFHRLWYFPGTLPEVINNNNNNHNNKKLYLHGHKKELQHCKRILKNNKKGPKEPSLIVLMFFFSTVLSCSLANSDDENMNIVLRNVSGVIKSPWYPHGFPDALEDKCHWKIIAPKGKVVRIEFLSFRVYLIYAQISDRINRLHPRTVKFSGKLPSFNFYSTGNELSIMVKGYFGNRGAGFIANYSSIDSGEKRESLRPVP